jgi:hypothetical protein
MTAPYSELLTGWEVIGHEPLRQPTLYQYTNPAVNPINTPIKVIITRFAFTGTKIDWRSGASL